MGGGKATSNNNNNQVTNITPQASNGGSISIGGNAGGGSTSFGGNTSASGNSFKLNANVTANFQMPSGGSSNATAAAAESKDMGLGLQNLQNYPVQMQNHPMQMQNLHGPVMCLLVLV